MFFNGSKETTWKDLLLTARTIHLEKIIWINVYNNFSPCHLEFWTSFFLSLCFWIMALAVHSLYSSQRLTRFFDLASCRAFSMKRYRINTRLVCAMIDGVHYNLHLMRVKWLLAISLQESLNLHVLYLRFSSIHV